MNKAAWAFLLALCFGCTKHETDFGGTGPVKKTDTLVVVDTTKPIDTLRIATYNMCIGFPVSQLLFTNMADSTVAYNALDTLYTRYQHGLPHERLRLMAEEIVRESLDVVGLQEVERLGKDTVPDDDFYAELLADIRAIGGPAYQGYRIVLNDTVLSGRLDGKSITIHFAEGNALLIKPEFQILDTMKIMYFNLLPIPIAGARKTDRAVNYARVRSPKGINWQFYNTHLEVFAEYSSGQAGELRKLVDTTLGNPTAPQIVLGDFNTLPKQDAHEVMLEGGFRDTYDGVAADSGFTCCLAFSELWNPDAAFSNRRIDFIMAKRIANVLEHRTTLAAPGLAQGGVPLYESDHRMVISKIVAQ